MAEAKKDTIYIDVDDEITGIIDKIQGSDAKIVALVLPKRAAVLQSVVNMKLLKRAADSSDKNVVLITTEAGLLPLAGATGLHVAKTLTSKPEVPSAPKMDDKEETVDEDDEIVDSLEDTPDDVDGDGILDDNDDEVTVDNSGDKPIGALAAKAPAPLPSANEVETLQLDDEDDVPVIASKKDFTPPAEKAAKKSAKKKKDSKLKVPNFDKFRIILIAGVVVLVLLIIGFIVANNVLPKATITIKTDATKVNVNTTVTLSTTAHTADAVDGIIPAKQVTQNKTYTQTVQATGQKNEGDKATGTVSIAAGDCSGDTPDDLPNGGQIKSSAGLSYILGDSVTFAPTVSHGHCTWQGVSSKGQNQIPITAQAGGSNYNMNSGSFTVYGESGMAATGSASGGTDNNVTVVSQSDIDNATNKINTDDTTVKTALKNQLSGQNLYPITETYAAGAPKTNSNNQAGDEASSVTVTATITYTMYGAAKSDLQAILDHNINKQIDTGKQSILDDGLSRANFAIGGSDAVSISTVAEAGPHLDKDQIVKESLGKKPGDVRSELTSSPDVTDVEVKLSPFWVTSVPGKASKVTVVILDARD